MNCFKNIFVEPTIDNWEERQIVLRMCWKVVEKNVVDILKLT